MQLMINTHEETRETLLLASRFLADHAELMPNIDEGAPVKFATREPSINGPAHKIELTDGTRVDLGSGVTHVSVPGGTFPTSVAEASARIEAAGLVPVPPSNVLPFVVPPAPATSAMTAPAFSTMTQPSAPAFAPPAPSAPPAPAAGATPVSTIPSAPAAGNAGATVPAPEYDSAGLAWDARIHQQGRGKKRDGTWMLKRRVDAGLVESVTKELLATKGTPTPAAPPAPTAEAPPAPGLDPNTMAAFALGGAPAAAAAVPLPAAESVLVSGTAPVFVPPPGPVVGVSAPPASAPVQQQPAGPAAVPAAAAPPNPLRDFVMKCARLVNGGMITKEQQDSAVQQAGVPSMQALAQRPDLVAAADYYVSKVAGLVA